MMQLLTLTLAYVLLYIGSSSAHHYSVTQLATVTGFQMTANISRLERPACQSLRGRADDQWCLGLVSNCRLRHVIRLPNNEARLDYSIIFNKNLLNYSFTELKPFEQEWIVQMRMNKNQPHCLTSVQSYSETLKPHDYTLTGPLPEDICPRLLKESVYADGRVIVCGCMLKDQGNGHVDGKPITTHTLNLRISPPFGLIEKNHDITLQFLAEVNNMCPRECINGYRE